MSWPTLPQLRGNSAPDTHQLVPPAQLLLAGCRSQGAAPSSSAFRREHHPSNNPRAGGWQGGRLASPLQWVGGGGAEKGSAQEWSLAFAEHLSSGQRAGGLGAHDLSLSHSAMFAQPSPPQGETVCLVSREICSRAAGLWALRATRSQPLSDGSLFLGLHPPPTHADKHTHTHTLVLQ